MLKHLGELCLTDVHIARAAATGLATWWRWTINGSNAELTMSLAKKQRQMGPPPQAPTCPMTAPDSHLLDIQELLLLGSELLFRRRPLRIPKLRERNKHGQLSRGCGTHPRDHLRYCVQRLLHVLHVLFCKPQLTKRSGRPRQQLHNKRERSLPGGRRSTWKSDWPTTWPYKPAAHTTHHCCQSGTDTQTSPSRL